MVAFNDQLHTCLGQNVGHAVQQAESRQRTRRAAGMECAGIEFRQGG
jgi:hypothetical protein